MDSLLEFILIVIVAFAIFTHFKDDIAPSTSVILKADTTNNVYLISGDVFKKTKAIKPYKSTTYTVGDTINVDTITGGFEYIDLDTYHKLLKNE